MTEFEKELLLQRKTNSKEINFKNVFFEIYPSKVNSEKYILKCNGKQLSNDGEKAGENCVEFYEIKCKPEELLNCYGNLFPQFAFFSCFFSNEKKSDYTFLFNIERKKNTILLNICICIQEKDFWEYDINPIKHLSLFLDLAKKIGYKVENPKKLEDKAYIAYIHTKLPTNQNLYQSYQKLLIDLRNLLKKAEVKMGNKKISIR